MNRLTSATMVALIFLFLNLIGLLLKSKSRLEAENAALRHQLTVLHRKVRGRVQFTNSDRLFFILLYRWFPSVLKAMTIIRPETLVRWHRAGFRRYWRWIAGNRYRAASCPSGREPARGGPTPYLLDLRRHRRIHQKEQPPARPDARPRFTGPSPMDKVRPESQSEHTPVTQSRAIWKQRSRDDFDPRTSQYGS
jgi:hypothetical protein